jgi:RNA-binding protein with serine-rich domain 1
MTDNTKIVVEKLTKNVNENHLREIFSKYGTIQDLDLPINRQCKLYISYIFEPANSS